MVQTKSLQIFAPLFIVLLLTGITLPISNSFADQQRINLYEISRPYWDIKPNETLGEIIKQLVPSNIIQNRRIKQQLISHIIDSNRHAFINNDPKRMLAHERLWFTNAKTIDTERNTTIKRYSWGYIKQIDSAK